MSETRPLLEPIYDVTDGIASPASKIQYRFAFGRFLEYIQISQEGLLQKNRKELQASIIDYIRHLTAKRMKPGTIKLMSVKMTVKKKRESDKHDTVKDIFH